MKLVSALVLSLGLASSAYAIEDLCPYSTGNWNGFVGGLARMAVDVSINYDEDSHHFVGKVKGYDFEGTCVDNRVTIPSKVGVFKGDLSVVAGRLFVRIEPFDIEITHD